MSDLMVLQAWLGKVKKQLERAEKKFGPFGPHMVAMSHLEATDGLLRALIKEEEEPHDLCPECKDLMEIHTEYGVCLREGCSMARSLAGKSESCRPEVETDGD